MSIYIGNKAIKHIYKGSKFIRYVYRGGVKIWEDTNLNSAGTATIGYTNATGNAAIVSITNGQTIYTRTSSFSNWTKTESATWSINAGNELQLVAALSSGDVAYTINASNGLNAITKLRIEGTRNSNNAGLFLTLPAMPNLESISLSSGWSSYVFLRSTSDSNTASTIKKLLPNSETIPYYLLLQN